MAFGSRGFYSCVILLLLLFSSFSKVDGSVVANQNPPPSNITGKLCHALFLIHFAIFMGVVLLLPYSVSKKRDANPKFIPNHFYIPLVSSVSTSSLTAVLYLLFTLRRPYKAVTFFLNLAPTLTVLLGMAIGFGASDASFILGVLTGVFGGCLFAYAAWFNDRVPHAREILSASIRTKRLASWVGIHVVFAVAAGTAYACFLTLGVGGVAAYPTRFDALFLFLLFLNLTWVMQVARNVVHVAVSHIEHALHAGFPEVLAYDAFRGAQRSNIGDICFGSLVAPFVTLVRGMARGKRLLAGNDDICCSGHGCCNRITDWMVAHANRWGFVHVGIYGKGFLKASKDTWELFKDQGMVKLVDMDHTGPFCFFCGVAGGALSALVACIWVLVLDKTSLLKPPENAYFLWITACAFLAGYFIIRIAMAWPQACVSAYHVVYAESKQNNQLEILNQLGSAIPDGIEDLQAMERWAREREMQPFPSVSRLYYRDDDNDDG